MNFFEYQDRARHNTQLLIGLFAIAILGMIIAVYIAVLVFIGTNLETETLSVWNLELFLLVAIPTIAVIGGGSYFKLVSLQQGGQVIATDLGGRLIPLDTTNFAERQLLNVVEEMAIASGISVPAVYVLDQEAGINAFAAGFTSNDAVIGVTRGTLELLNRDELQGVVGHEFSHILNGDMRLNLRLVGLLHGILMIYIIGRILVRSTSHSRQRSRSRRKGEASVGLGLALMAIGMIGLVCGRLIKSAVSRQREFLADASSVQFTRNPAGIAGALLKISNHSSRAWIDSPHAETNSHLFFGSAVRFNLFSTWFETHPPLNQRIRRLQTLEGQYAATGIERSLHDSEGHFGTMGCSDRVSLGRGPAHSSQQPAMAGIASGSARSNLIQVAPEQVLARVGTVTPEQFAQTQAWLEQLPELLRIGLQQRQQAMAIVYALMIHQSPSTIQKRQKTWLQKLESLQMVEDTLQFSQIIHTLDARMRLPLLDLTIPVLRQGSVNELQTLFKGVSALAKAAGHWSLKDFVIYLVLFHRLKPSQSQVSSIPQYTQIGPIWPDCLLVLSALAQVGQTGQEAITYAFRSGIYRLPGVGKFELPPAPPACNFSSLHQSLQRLRAASPKLKQAIVDACAHTVLLDQKVTLQEADLLRAIVITLDCPFPPFLRA